MSRERTRKILRPLSAARGSRTRQVPDGADFYLARLYEVPLLSQEEETYLFRKMNYLKFRADRLRRRLNPRTANAAQVEKIEGLQAEALEVRNRIVEANLRLVFSIVKRYAAVGSAAFDEFMGEGHVTLMRAVEKFDFSRGVKFSTYATWAIVNGCNAFLKKQGNFQRQQSFQGVEGVEDAITDHRVTIGEEQSVQALRQAVGELLLGLNTRERAIIEARFGFDLHAATTLKAIGEDLGISKERVRQLQQRALEKLRELAETQQPGIARPSRLAKWRLDQPLAKCRKQPGCDQVGRRTGIPPISVASQPEVQLAQFVEVRLVTWASRVQYPLRE